MEEIKASLDEMRQEFPLLRESIKTHNLHKDMKIVRRAYLFVVLLLIVAYVWSENFSTRELG